MTRRIFHFIRGVAIAGTLAFNAVAHEDEQFFVATPWQGPAMAQSSLIIAPGELSDEYAEGEGIVGGLHVKLKPGWFTYWRTPGESGLPPAFVLTAGFPSLSHGYTRGLGFIPLAFRSVLPAEGSDN